jgi:hypothetical protein
MIITEIKKLDDQVVGFEIQNFLLSRGYTLRILRSVHDIHLIRTPLFLSRLREVEFCEFELGGQIFRVWEPLGDRNYMRRSLKVRHVIGTKNSGPWREHLASVRRAFVHPDPK